MIDHEKRRYEDSAFGKLIYSWPAIVGVASVIYSLAKGATILESLAAAAAKSSDFQQSQIAINTKLQTLLDAQGNRLDSLEGWRDRTNRYR